MSLAIKYEAVHDAQMRLRGTVVRYKDEPVYITEVAQGAGGDEPLRVFFKELPLGQEKAFKDIDEFVKEQEAAKRKFISSKHFDIEPFRLGYVNSERGAFYCSRTPNRIQKQGLCEDNFRAVDNFGRVVAFGDFLRTKELLAMVQNRYPSFQVALAALKKVNSVAFSRDFSLVKDVVIPDLIYIYHKGEKVGMYNATVSRISLGDKFSCLRESLAELGVNG